MPQPLGSRGSVCEDHSHSWHSLTILSPITDLLQRLPMIPEIESGLASSPTEWTSGEVCEVSDISGESLWQLVIVGSLWCQCFSLMVKELENFSLPLFRDNRREDLPPGLFICTDFYTAFFHYIIFQQTVEKLTWYPKAKPKLASGSWLFTSIASLLHTNWKDVVSTVKYCCR